MAKTSAPVKPVIFLSHIQEEAKLAVLIKKELEKAFLNGVEVFVSSIPASLPMGQKWMDDISINLKNCKIEIVLASPKALGRPWIWFESGAGWVRDIPVIPLCHSGMTPSKLPPPMSFLQGAQANDPTSLTGVFSVVAKEVNLALPDFDFRELAQEISNLEEKYTYWDSINEAVQVFLSYKPDFFTALDKNDMVGIDIPDITLLQVQPMISFFMQKKLINFVATGSIIGPGIRTRFQATKLEDFSVFKDKRCLIHDIFEH